MSLVDKSSHQAYRRLASHDIGASIIFRIFLGYLSIIVFILMFLVPQLLPMCMRFAISPTKQSRGHKNSAVPLSTPRLLASSGKSPAAKLVDLLRQYFIANLVLAGNDSGGRPTTDQLLPGRSVKEGNIFMLSIGGEGAPSVWIYICHRGRCCYLRSASAITYDIRGMHG